MKIHSLPPLAFLFVLLGSCSEQGAGNPPGGSGATPATGGTQDSGAGGMVIGVGGAISGGGGTVASGGDGNAPTGGGPAGGTGSGGGGAPSGGASGGTAGDAAGGALSSGGAHGVGGAGTGGMAPVADPPRLQNAEDGRATHYWDCCKPSCAWPDQGTAKSCTADNQTQSDPDEQSGCFGGNSYQCWSMAPWAVSDTLAYGFAAFNAGTCGSCYQLEFTGSSSAGYEDPGAAAISHKIMIVQTLNRGGIAQGQFDILVPGGGVGDFDACSSQWNAHGDLGVQYGGFFLECRQQNGGNHDAAKQCARSKCEQTFAGGDQTDLLEGCLFWLDWANMADNPNFKFGAVDCPAAIQAVSGM